MSHNLPGPRKASKHCSATVSEDTLDEPSHVLLHSYVLVSFMILSRSLYNVRASQDDAISMLEFVRVTYKSSALRNDSTTPKVYCRMDDFSGPRLVVRTWSRRSLDMQRFPCNIRSQGECE